MPLSLILFIATGIIFLLQVFPYTGIFLLFLLAPAWSIVTVNLGMAVLAVEALTGRVRRSLVLVPLAYATWYLVLAAGSHLELERLQREFASANAEALTRIARVPFDQARHDLVFDRNEGGATLRALVQRYGLRAGFTADPDAAPKASHRMFRLAARELCERLRDNPEFAAAGIRTGFIYNSDRAERAKTQGICTLDQPQDPANPVFTVSQKEARRPGRFLTASVTEIVLRLPDGTSHDLLTGRAAAYPWFPMPVMGCGLNSGKPAWECDVAFSRGTSQPLATDFRRWDQNAGILAQALGLAPTEPTEMKPTAEELAELDAHAAEVRAIQERDELARLDELLADPTFHRKESGFYRFPLLQQRPDLTRSRAPAMVTALEQAVTAISGLDTARVLADLLARMPAETFAPLAGRIATVLEAPAPVHPARRKRDRPEQDERYRPRNRLDTLVIRSGDAGEVALPALLADIAPEKRRPSAAAILALCRMGPPAADAAGPRIAEILRTTKRRDDAIHSAAYVALLRLGMRENALADPDAAATYQHKWYERVAETVTPASPPSACMSSRDWPKLPG